MYYPLLRARQFELIALRELAIEGATKNYIWPIIEPVKGNHNNLNLAQKIFAEKGQQAYLILNPRDGENKGDKAIYLNYQTNSGADVFIPAFYYQENASYINKAIEDFRLSDCMILCQNDLNPDDADFRALVNRKEISLINIEDPERNRGLKRFIKDTGKPFIRRDDLFEKEPTNSDYLAIDEHRFTEEHMYYREEGYHGFCDFTVLSSEYIEGGGMPRAVVIHWTYLKDNGSIWIRHFTSTSNDSIADVQGKFAQAAKKAVNFCSEMGLHNSAITELRDYFNREHYPGLGTVKKLSIKNHLLVMSHYLKDQ